MGGLKELIDKLNLENVGAYLVNKNYERVNFKIDKKDYSTGEIVIRLIFDDIRNISSGLELDKLELRMIN